MNKDYDNNDVTFRICAVLPASGTGSRMAMEIPKQFYEIAGKPLLIYTLEAINKISWIEKSVVVVPAAYEQYTEQLLTTHQLTRVMVTCGSQSRHKSIYNGIVALDDNDPPDVVIIHDAVRPLINEDILRNVAMAAMIYGASGCTRPLVSTVIKATDDNMLEQSLDRSVYRASEMPQAFQYEVIKEAYEKCTDYDFEYGTECLHLAQKYADSTVKLIDGPPSLWKITYKKDLYAFEGIIKEYLYEIAVIVGDKETVSSVCMSAKYLISKGLKIAILTDSCREDIQSTMSEVSERYLYHNMKSMTNDNLSEAFRLVEDSFRSSVDIVINCVTKDYAEAIENVQLITESLNITIPMLTDLIKSPNRQAIIVNSILLLGNACCFDSAGLYLEAKIKESIRIQSKEAINVNVQVCGVFDSPHIPKSDSDGEDGDTSLELCNLATDIVLDIKNYVCGQTFSLV